MTGQSTHLDLKNSLKVHLEDCGNINSLAAYQHQQILAMEAVSSSISNSSSSDNWSHGEVPDWLLQYNSEMEAVARKFPVSEEEMSAIHTKYYDVAFEKLMLSNSGPATENSPKRPVEDRIRSKKERALLAAAKQRFVDMNDSAGTVPYLTQLGGNRHGPLSEDAAVKFINSIIAACNSEANATKQIKLAAAAICQRVGGPGEDMVKLAAVKAEADSAMEAQIGANRLLGSRVEELERENSELHRILDDNTNKALDSWSSGQLKIAKLEEEVKNTKEEKKASDKAAADAKEEIKQLEIKLERLKAKMEAFVDEEKKEEGGFMETAFACIPGIAGFNVKE